MQIAPIERDLLPRATAAYNRAIDGVPHCWPVDKGKFSAALETMTGEAKSHKNMQSKATFVAVEGSSVVGFVDAAVGYPNEGGEYVERGLIRFLWYEPGRREVGQALLRRAEQHVREHGQACIQAFPQEYRLPCYYLHAAFMSDRLGHVAALLAVNGYRRIRGEVFMNWPNFEPMEPEPCNVAAGFTVEWKPGFGRLPNVKVIARLEDKAIGDCSCESFGEVHRAEDAQDWFFTTWLGVERDYQGKGVGKHLLRRALVEMHGAGYRNAAISTALDNHRAFLFYTNFGYRVVDWTYGYGRQLE